MVTISAYNNAWLHILTHIVAHSTKSSQITAHGNISSHCHTQLQVVQQKIVTQSQIPAHNSTHGYTYLHAQQHIATPCHTQQHMVTHNATWQHILTLSNIVTDCHIAAHSNTWSQISAHNNAYTGIVADRNTQSHIATLPHT